MALDERSRHELYLKLEELLGPESATALMEMLPPVGWADVATKRDLDQLAAVLRAEFAHQTRTIVLAMLGSSLAILGTTLGAVFAVT
ncbi:MAG: hypothetical protein ACRD0O_17230 [Acidimicrobiia bacterium]